MPPERGRAAFTRISRPPRLSERVADEVLASILEQRLRPGDRLPSERELGDQFGVSRTVIREATRSLVVRGVIAAHPGVGLTVASVEGEALAASMNLFLRSGAVRYEKVHEVRTTLEIQVTRLAAARRSNEQLTA